MSPRRYSKVSRRIWNDATFRALSAPQPCGQALFLRLLTGPELTNIPGLIPVGEGALSEALGWSLEAFREAFREVSREGLAEGDWEARLVFVPKAIFHNEPQSPNVIAAWATAWDEAPECTLKMRAWEVLRGYTKSKGSAWLDAFDKACPKPSWKAPRKPSVNASGKATANQEQEQKQEQEQARPDARKPGLDLPDPTQKQPRAGDILGPCPKCGAPIQVKFGQRGIWAPCSNRSCDYKLSEVGRVISIGTAAQPPEVDPEVRRYERLLEAETEAMTRNDWKAVERIRGQLEEYANRARAKAARGGA